MVAPMTERVSEPIAIIIVRLDDVTCRVSINDGRPVAEFTCDREDVPALIDAHVVALVTP